MGSRLGTGALLVLLGCAGCGAGAEARSASLSADAPVGKSTAVPEEFRPACGKPGSEVATEREHVVIRRSDCVLTGVSIVNGEGGLTVPDSGGVANSAGMTVFVNAQGDVTYTTLPATAPPP